MWRFLFAVLALVCAGATAVPSLGASAERFPVSDLIFQSTNDCTGNFTTWTQSNQFITFRRDVAADGAEHLTEVITGDVSTADGFSGRFAAAIDTNSKETDPFFVGETGAAITYVMTGPDGRLLLTHEEDHFVRLSDGSVRSEVSDVKRRCLGNPT